MPAKTSFQGSNAGRALKRRAEKTLGKYPQSRQAVKEALKEVTIPGLSIEKTENQ